jgi:hypothetical protein
VVLFVLSIILIFLGTLAQKDQGLWTVLTRYFRSGLAEIPYQVFVRFGQVFLNVSPDLEVEGFFYYPGGWLLGGLLLANLLAAHIVRFKMSWKRSGILLIHGGLIVMMLSELFTGLFAVEARMVIPTGQSSNYVEDHRAVELAIIDKSDPDSDEVVVIPGSLLRKGGTISQEDLPFDVEVVQYMANSTMPVRLKRGAKVLAATGMTGGTGVWWTLKRDARENLATAGDGQDMWLEEKPEVTGVSTEQESDHISAYVTFRKKDTGKSLGTYLVTQWWSSYWDGGFLERPQKVRDGEKEYQVFLRNKRTYKPYTIHLKEFHHDVYVGTNKPKNFSSRVRVVDPSRVEDREVVISMNAPLRYAGETFYQSGVLPNDRGTILQVVDNPGWLLPYISCVMVAVGMVIHFLLHLIGFLNRRAVR